MGSIIAASEPTIISDKIVKDNRSRAQRRLFLSIGCALSLSFVLLAFEWKTEQVGQVVDLGELQVQFEALQYVPITSQAAPTPPKIMSKQVVIIPDEVEIEEVLELDLEPELAEETVVEELVLEYSPEEEVFDEIFEIVEQSAEPAIGLSEFYQYIAKNLVYPQAALAAGVEGKVYLQFVVDQQGNISQITTLKGLGFGCDKEAIRVMKASPNWLPAKQQGRAVKSKVTLPLVFKLS